MENYRISPEAAVYYLTYSVVEWLPVFVSEASCKIITASRLIAKRLQEAPGTMMVFLPMTIRPGADRERRFWQPSRQPEAVQGERFWQQKVDYLHDSPCREGLVRSAEHWRFSSALWYASEGRQGVDVPLTAVEW